MALALSGITVSKNRGRWTADLVDVDGSFARFLREAPTVLRKELRQAVRVTTLSVENDMRIEVRASAFLTGDLYRALDVQLPQRRGLTGRAGILNNEEQAHVGLYNEYSPNWQKFALPAADRQRPQFIRRATDALRMTERTLAGFAGPKPTGRNFVDTGFV